MVSVIFIDASFRAIKARDSGGPSVGTLVTKLLRGPPAEAWSRKRSDGFDIIWMRFNPPHDIKRGFIIPGVGMRQPFIRGNGVFVSYDKNSPIDALWPGWGAFWFNREQMDEMGRRAA